MSSTVRVLTRRAARAASWTAETLALIVRDVLLVVFGFLLGALYALTVLR